MTTEVKLPEAIGPYRVKSKIGQGGMGTVFHAVHETLERPVALKMLPSELSADPEYVTRFLREARVVATLRHENVVQVYDAGSVEGKYFIAMELVEGDSLAKYLQEKNKLPEAEGLDLLRQAALGLQAAHEKGLVHRDIKPDNMLLSKDRKTLRLVDFGLVMESTSTTQLTATGATLGTPQFMSPEQADGEKADARADIYSLGVTFFLALTGQAPFNSPTVMNLLFKHKFELPPDPRAINPELSENVCNLILTMMAKPREHRPQTAADVVKLVDEVRAGKKISPPPAWESPVTSGMTISSVSAPTAPLAAAGSTQAAPAASKSLGPLPFVAGVGAGLLVLVAAGWMLFSGDGKTQADDGTSAAVSTQEPEDFIPKNPIDTPEDLDPNDIKAAVERGDLHMVRKEFREALGAYTIAHNKNADEPGLKAKYEAAQKAVRRLELIAEGETSEQAGDVAKALDRYLKAAEAGHPDELKEKIEGLRYQVLVQEAKQADLKGDLDTALQKAEEANLIRDASALIREFELKAYVARAQEAVKKGEYTQAAMLYDQAAEAAPEDRLKQQYREKAAEARREMFVQNAQELEKKEEWLKASEAYDQAIRIKTDPALVVKRDEARKKALADSDYTEFMKQGQEALDARNLDAAREFFKKAFEAKPKSTVPGEKIQEVDAWRVMEAGDRFKAVGDYARAKVEYAKVAGICPKLRGLADQRIADAVNAEKQSVSAADLTAQVERLVENGQTADAERLVVNLLVKNPNNTTLQAMRTGVERLSSVERICTALKRLAQSGRAGALGVLEVDRGSNDGQTIRDTMERRERDAQARLDEARARFKARGYDGLSGSLDASRTLARDLADDLADAQRRIDKKARDTERSIGFGPVKVQGDAEGGRRLRRIAEDFGRQSEEARQYSR